ncbi:MAG: putative cytosolic protein [uncultured bacterium]|nr:MAG: putative cytosolic protein [uncultured bacterium]
MPFRISKIISGGQTGVDRAALDWAISQSIAHGGWCPKGRLAEDGILDSRYQLTEVPFGSYRQRTRRNVEDSDGTLILNVGPLEGGTLSTKRFAEKLGKPLFMLQLDFWLAYPLLAELSDWVARHDIRVLNVAGPRESRYPGVYGLATEVLVVTWSCSEKCANC